MKKLLLSVTLIGSLVSGVVCAQSPASPSNFSHFGEAIAHSSRNCSLIVVGDTLKTMEAHGMPSPVIVFKSSNKNVENVLNSIKTNDCPHAKELVITPLQNHWVSVTGTSSNGSFAFDAYAKDDGIIMVLSNSNDYKSG